VPLEEEGEKLFGINNDNDGDDGDDETEQLTQESSQEVTIN
jgi:hypothetical protein